MASAVTGINSGSSGTGLDVGATVDQIMYAERAPERLMQSQQQMLNAQASALRDIQSRLTTLGNTVNSLKDVSASMGARIASSSQSSILSASADRTATIGKHVITVNSLATTSSWYSDAVADGVFTPGDLTIQVGTATPITFTFDAGHSTLAAAAEFINTKQAGVMANVITDATGLHLALVSATSGAAGDIKLLQAPAEIAMHRGSTGANADVVVDGVPVQSSTNSLTGVIPGVTFELSSASPGTQVTVSVAPDAARARQAISDFVTSYNSVVGNINAQFTYNQQTGSAGPLAGNSSIRGVQATLLPAMSQVVKGNGAITSLASLGIDMKNDGTLQMNSTELDAALSQHFTEVQSFFQSREPEGFACRLSAQMAVINDSIDGPLAVDITGLGATSRMISDQIDDLESRLDMRRKTLLDQYSRIDTMLRQFPLIQAQLTAQLESLK
ncbi:MAG TPA: flagellar filament capping protein FliD [Clostridia bacterium]|nr:flagellar filament capping protein FliD [Clostridia bacterium]